MSADSERYVLATGREAARRLTVVNSVHGYDTIGFLMRAGVNEAASIADIGCGVGAVLCPLVEIAENIQEAVGVDVSAAQVEEARRTAAEYTKFSGSERTRFVCASAYETGLADDSFDLVFSRFLLMHVQRPERAIAEMTRILKPGGILALEDGDFTTPFCHPPAPAYDRCFELYRLSGERHGADFRIGPKLYNLVKEAGFDDIEVSLAQPLFVRGEPKRLPEWTLAENAPALIEDGLATRDEIDALAQELAALAADETTQFGMVRMTQVRGRKPA